jgi:hypothetical protein
MGGNDNRTFLEGLKETKRKKKSVNKRASGSKILPKHAMNDFLLLKCSRKDLSIYNVKEQETYHRC